MIPTSCFSTKRKHLQCLEKTSYPIFNHTNERIISLYLVCVAYLSQIKSVPIFFLHFFFFWVGKSNMHPMGFELTTSYSNQSYGRNKYHLSYSSLVTGFLFQLLSCSCLPWFQFPILLLLPIPVSLLYLNQSMTGWPQKKRWLWVVPNY